MAHVNKAVRGGLSGPAKQVKELPTDARSVLIAILMSAQTERPLKLHEIHEYYNTYARDTGLHRHTEEEVALSVEVLQTYSILISSNVGNFGGRRIAKTYRINVKAADVLKDDALEGVHREQLRTLAAPMAAP